MKKLPLKEAHINKAFPVVIFTIVQEKVNDYGGKCQVCDDVLTFWHDIRCAKCDQRLVMWCPTCQIHRDFSDEIHPIKLSNEYNLNAELKRLKIPILDKSKISRFLKKLQGKEDVLPGIIFLKELSDVIAKSNAKEKTIIIYGEKAAEFANHISSDKRCQYSTISYRNDKYGILEKLQKATITREEQINRYNYPSQTLF